MHTASSAIMSQAGDKAFFYPNLCQVFSVKVLGKTIYVSHDLGTASYEVRHFVDRRFLEASPEGQALLASLVDPIPPCSVMTGFATDDNHSGAVLGMLQRPLVISVRSDSGETAEFALHTVLVIDGLPVPLHVSAKSLMTIEDQSAVEILADQASMGPGRPQMEVNMFPEDYHTHPYWTDNTIMLGIGSGGIEEMSETSERISNAKKPERGHQRSCANCWVLVGTNGQPLLRCGACSKVYYCNATCQKAHWKATHKTSCQQG